MIFYFLPNGSTVYIWRLMLYYNCENNFQSNKAWSGFVFYPQSFISNADSPRDFYDACSWTLTLKMPRHRSSSHKKYDSDKFAYLLPELMCLNSKFSSIILAYPMYLWRKRIRYHRTNKTEWNYFILLVHHWCCSSPFQFIQPCRGYMQSIWLMITWLEWSIHSKITSNNIVLFSGYL